jgi:hypothetical protein
LCVWRCFGVDRATSFAEDYTMPVKHGIGRTFTPDRPRLGLEKDTDRGLAFCFLADVRNASFRGIGVSGECCQTRYTPIRSGFG